MTHARFRTPATLLAAAAFTALPAMGQQQQQDSRWDQQDYRSQQRQQQQQRDSGRQGYSDQDSMRMGRQNDQQVGGSWQYDQQQRPQSRWQGARQQQQQQQGRGFGEDNVRIAVDFDNDGNFDSYYTVSQQELNRLRLMAANRPMRGTPGMQGDQWQTTTRYEPDRWSQDRSSQDRWNQDRWNQDRWSQETQQRQWDQDRFDRQRGEERFGERSDQDRFGMQQGRAGTQTVRGEIESLNSVRLTGMRDEHLLARVVTDDGRVHNVDLGPSRPLNNLDLNEGDQITLTAMRGQINQRPVLFATSVQSRGRTVNVQRSAFGGGAMDAGQTQRADGRVLRTWQSRFDHDNKDHLLALVRLNTGETKLVDLGPEDRVDDLNIGRNDQISITGKPVNIDGFPALCARTIENDDEMMTVGEPSGVTDIRTENGDTERHIQRAGRVD